MQSEDMDGDDAQQQDSRPCEPGAPLDGETLDSPAAEAAPYEPRMRRGFSTNLMRAAKSHWGILRGVMMGGLRAMSLAKRDKQEFLAESTKALQDADAEDSAIKLQVKDVRELKKTNYVLQGDATFYSEEMINKRHKLRNNVEVMAAVKEWWDWLPKFNGAIEGLPVPSDLSRTYLAKPVYCAMVVTIQMVLLPRFGMKGRMNYDPEEDWLDDNKGQPHMDYPDFFDAMFELADVWCEQVNGYKYADLLQQTLRDAKKSGLMEKLLLKFGWFADYVVPNPNAAPPKPKPLPRPADPPPFIRPVVEMPKQTVERPQMKKRPSDVTCHKVDPADWFGSEGQPLSPHSTFSRDRDTATARLSLLASQGGSQDPWQKVYLVASVVAETQVPSLLHQQSLGHYSTGAVPSTLLFTSRPGTSTSSPRRAGHYGSSSTGSSPYHRKGEKEREPAAISGLPGIEKSSSFNNGRVALSPPRVPSISNLCQEKRGASMPQVTSNTASPRENPGVPPTAFEQRMLQQQQRGKPSVQARAQSPGMSKRPGAQQLAYYSGPLPHFKAGKAHPEVAERQQRMEEEWRLSAMG